MCIDAFVAHQRAMPFGAVDAVYAWGRIASAITQAIAKIIWLPRLRYVDDLLTAGIDPLADSSFEVTHAARGFLAPSSTLPNHRPRRPRKSPSAFGLPPRVTSRPYRATCPPVVRPETLSTQAPGPGRWSHLMGSLQGGHDPHHSAHSSAPPESRRAQNSTVVGVRSLSSPPGGPVKPRARRWLDIGLVAPQPDIRMSGGWVPTRMGGSRDARDHGPAAFLCHRHGQEKGGPGLQSSCPY